MLPGFTTYIILQHSIIQRGPSGGDVEANADGGLGQRVYYGDRWDLGRGLGQSRSLAETPHHHSNSARKLGLGFGPDRRVDFAQSSVVRTRVRSGLGLSSVSGCLDSWARVEFQSDSILGLSCFLGGDSTRSETEPTNWAHRHATRRSTRFWVSRPLLCFLFSFFCLGQASTVPDATRRDSNHARTGALRDRSCSRGRAGICVTWRKKISENATRRVDEKESMSLNWDGLEQRQGLRFEL
jgi:hypothetical protein